MSSVLTSAPSIEIETFLAQFGSQAEAAKELGLKSRQTFHDWRRAGFSEIPSPWSFRAKAVLDALSGREAAK